MNWSSKCMELVFTGIPFIHDGWVYIFTIKVWYASNIKLFLYNIMTLNFHMWSPRTIHNIVGGCCHRTKVPIPTHPACREGGVMLYYRWYMHPIIPRPWFHICWRVPHLHVALVGISYELARFVGQYLQKAISKSIFMLNIFKTPYVWEAQIMLHKHIEGKISWSPYCGFLKEVGRIQRASGCWHYERTLYSRRPLKRDRSFYLFLSI